ncbi:MAG: DMT family transporter [Opitutaceae bacterium]|nr:DMT family transporter [Opitutaceae bacterium]
MMRHHLLLLFGVFTCSTAVIMINASTTHPFVLAALRLTFASVLLAPLAWRELGRHRGTFTNEHWRRTLLPALVLALHFISWSYGARMTIAAQASLVVNLAPAAIPFFLHWIVGERINRVEILGTLIALAGVVLLSVRDALAGGGDFWGNVVCFGSMLLFAWYLALGRKNRDFPSLWLYVVPVYAQAAVICLLAAIPWLPTFAVHDSREWLLMLGLAVLPTIMGHSLLNASMRHLRGQVVSLGNVGQFIFAGVMAWLLFGQVPPVTFYGASLLVVAGVALVVFAAPSAPPRLR